jgi:hypothetical protein
MGGFWRVPENAIRLATIVAVGRSSRTVDVPDIVSSASRRHRAVLSLVYKKAAGATSMTENNSPFSAVARTLSFR